MTTEKHRRIGKMGICQNIRLNSSLLFDVVFDASSANASDCTPVGSTDGTRYQIPGRARSKHASATVPDLMSTVREPIKE